MRWFDGPMEPNDEDRTARTPRRSRRAVAGVAAAIAAIAGGGAAVAATTLSSPQEESQAIVSDAADRLGVEPQKLSDALEQAYEAQIDARVADGTLDKADGDRLKQRLQDGDVPLVQTPGRERHGDHGGRHGRGHGGPFAELAAAATYLGVTEDVLLERLRGGQTLAEVAKAEGKSVEGLKQALTAAATKELDARVASGELTEAQKASVLEKLSERLDDRIDGELRGPGDHRFGGRGFAFGEAAAAYLGLDDAALRERMRGGESLAEIAKAEGKTAEGLKQALTAAATKELDARVASGDLTEAQKQEALTELSARMDDLIAGTLPLRRGDRDRGGPPEPIAA
jgi:hypothetical protein